MSLSGLIKQALNGQATWGDVGTKIENLFVQDVVDPVEVFGEQFLTVFGKAALNEAAVYGPQIAQDLVSGNASQIPALIPVIAAKLEQDGITAGEQVAAQVIGNALRVQGTATAVAVPTAPATPVDPSPTPAPAA